jgi:hypothetical protein
MTNDPAGKLIKADRFSHLPDAAGKVVGGALRDGRSPALFVTPLLRAPIWNAPQLAARYHHQRKSWNEFRNGVKVTQIVEVSNQRAELTKEGESPRASPSGLLRYLDLDVLMCLAYNWTMTGERRIAREQSTLLRWMGYQSLDDAPWRELRASVRRLASTDIVIYDEGADLAEIDPIRLVTKPQMEEGLGRGNKGWLTAGLSEDWCVALHEIGWRTVDMRPYVFLAQKNREQGLARVIYLFLSSLRQSDGTFQCPMHWITNRFADKRGGPDGANKFANPLDGKSRFYKAWMALQETGVVKLNPLPPVDLADLGRQVITGMLTAGDKFPEIPRDQTGQQVFITLDKTTGIAYSSGDAEAQVMTSGSEVMGDPQPAAPLPPPRHPLGEEKPATPPPSERQQPDKFDRLLRYVPLGKSDLNQAKADGWQQHHLNHLLYIALWLKHCGKIDSPMAFARRELVDKRPDAYSKEAIKTNYPVGQISAWLKSPDGPLRANDG